MPIDFLGESHARSAERFAWVWDLPGANEFVSGEMNYREVNALADSFKSYDGTNHFWLSAPLLEGKLDEGVLVRAWKWYEECCERELGFGEGSTVLLEFMQEVSSIVMFPLTSLTSNDAIWVDEKCDRMPSPPRARAQQGPGRIPALNTSCR